MSDIPGSETDHDDGRVDVADVRVLVVAKDAIRVARVLRTAGFERITAARDAAEGLAQLEVVVPGLILLDIPDPRLIDGRIPAVLLSDMSSAGILKSVRAVLGDDDGPLTQDDLNAALAKEVDSLKKLMRNRPLNRRILDNAKLRAMERKLKTQDMRMRLIEETTRSLNDYVRYSGPAVEQDVLDVHLDALMQLINVPFSHQDEAVTIVNHLTALVAKRRRSRKVAS